MSSTNNKILLMGNPNVGKSAVFSRLSGARVNISNYPGSTVEFIQSHLKIGQKKYDIIDVPGTYSFETTSKAEQVAIEMLDKDAVVINVIDATNLERNLYLTLELLQKGFKVIVALNMWDETKHKGIKINTQKLQKHLGVPVVNTCAITGEGIKELVGKIEQAKKSKFEKMEVSKKWEAIGTIITDVQELFHRHHTFLERIEDLSIKPFTGLLFAGFVMYISFMIIRFIGEGLIGFVFDPMFENFWMPVMQRLNEMISAVPFLAHVLVGNLIDGKIDMGLSFGVLTTGLYVPLAMVLPYIFSFYLVLGILEDVGYLPRLAVLMDNVMHKIGLHGYAIVPFILGLGCNVPGAMALRVLESRREKFIAATLMATAVPCMAQIAMITGLVGERGGQYLGIVFGTLVVVFIVKGMILNKIIKGESPEILLEIPSYRKPPLQAIFKKLLMRITSFLKEAIPMVLAGVLVVNLLYGLGIIDFFSKIIGPILTKLFGLPYDAVPALVMGFLRKDIAVGMLGPLALTNKQLVIGATILALYFPCIATFMVLVKELGIKDMLKSLGCMLITTLIVGSLLNLIL